MVIAPTVARVMRNRGRRSSARPAFIAIRSGVSRDGRQLHWQGMTWDQLSNLDEEDLRAIVAYVRLLPPVNRAVPLPHPPAADDCETYTFYFEKSNHPGGR
jgi:hypothetical protein